MTFVSRNDLEEYVHALVEDYHEVKGGATSCSKHAKKQLCQPHWRELNNNVLNNRDDEGKPFSCALEAIVYAHIVQKTPASTPQHNKAATPKSPAGCIVIQSPDVTIPAKSPDATLPANQNPSNNDFEKLFSFGDSKQAVHLRHAERRPATGLPQINQEQSPQRPASASSCTVSSFQRRKKKQGSNLTVTVGWIDERAQTAPNRSPFSRHHMKSFQGAQSSRTGKARSKENWIPEGIRQRMVRRDLTVAKQNYDEKETYASMRDSNHCKLDSLERSRSKEKYGIEQRKPCGLCCTSFLPVNLVMAVPLKAVLDMRDSWGSKFDADGCTRVRVNPNLRKPPACYNKTKLCVFCAQLFDQQQEAYRPSWEAKEAEKERIRKVEEEAQQNVLNDPLAQVREEEMRDLSKGSGNGSTGVTVQGESACEDTPTQQRRSPPRRQSKPKEHTGKNI